ncbi:uncharacterized protein LOC120318592 isoform X3 [Crotalus tigris]|uniref:uncharacterized protein LOC120318592 isoform X3 n=1 Tax=Crotalus tigris TaxID=88082 RepID=UPI00192F7336|nr:uncharacterized protein LOC120318592 isoform X3 [Crotalus tigris]
MACPGAKSIKGTEDKDGRPSLSGARGELSCLGGYGGNEAHRARRTAKPRRVPGRILGARRRRLPAPLVTFLRKGRRLRGTRPGKSTCSTIPGEMAKALKAEDKKFESALCRSHQASAWAVKASTSLAFFARVSIMWLRELQDLVPPDQVCVHQTLTKLVAASQYMADASLHAARYSSRAIAADISARRLLWLKNWHADLKAKWCLAIQPYNGRHLFGEALNPYLVEGKDKRKTMIKMSKRGDWQSGSGTSHHYFRRQSSRPASNWDWPQPPSTFTQRPDTGQRHSSRPSSPFKAQEGIPSEEPSDSRDVSPIGG